MLKILYASCPSLSLAILAQFTLKICVAGQYREKFTENPYFGSSRSFIVIDVTPLRSSSITSACYDKQDICAYLQLFSC